MQRNKIKAKDKLIDILNAFLKGNPINSFEKLLSLTSEQHRYLDQWKKLNVDPQTLEKVVDIIRRFEANGLQLEGKGVWVLLMCFKYCYNGEKLAKETQTSLVETLIRIALEHSVYVDCIEILQYVVDNMELTPSEVFQIGCNISDQLPTTIACPNFIALLNFCMKCVRRDPKECMLQATRFLFTVVVGVDKDYNANYFLSTICTALLRPLGEECDTTEEVQSSTLRLLSRLISLSPLHPQQVMDTQIPSIVIKIAVKCSETFTDGEAASTTDDHSKVSASLAAEVFSFLLALCQDPQVCRRLRRLVDHSVLRGALRQYSREPAVLEAVTRLFLALNETELDCLYPGRPAVANREELVEFIRSALEMSLEVTNELLAAYHSDKVGAPSEDTQQLVHESSLQSMVGDEPEETSCFCHLNRLVQAVDLAVKLNQVAELFPVVDNILHLLLLQTQDVKTFDLSHVNITDSVVLLLGKKERCWWAAKEDPLDVDFLNVSTDLVAQFGKITASNKLFDTNDMKTLHYLAGAEDEGVKRTISKLSDMPDETPAEEVPSSSSKKHRDCGPEECDCDATEALTAAAMDHLTTNMKFCTTRFIQHVLFLKGFLDSWEAEDVRVTSRKLLLVFCIAAINGVETLQPVVDVKSLEEVAWELLRDERLGLGAFPQMQRKCIQLITLFAIESEGPLTNCVDIAEFVLKIMTTKEENGGDLPLMYSCLSCLLALADKERSVRRKVITYFGKLYEVFETLDPVDSISPLLHLAGQMLEFMTKLELDGEQCLVTLIIRALLSRSRKVKAHACDLISEIGGASPGIIHRGIGRREVEDVLVSLLQKVNTAHHPRLVLSVLKACNVFVHDVNLKPYWLPNPWGYHWSDYKSDLSSRPMLNAPFVETLLSVMHRAPPSYRMLYFSICLSIASSLMYNCSDGIVNPNNKQDVANLTLLKDTLIANILPWLPIAVDFITIGKKNIGTSKKPPVVVHVRHKRGSLGQMLDHTKKQLDLIASNLVKKQLAISENSENNGHSAAENSDKSQARTSSSGSRTNSNGSGSRFGFRRGKDSKSAVSSAAEEEDLEEDALLSGSSANKKKNLSMEFLTEKTVDGLYSFLCMDEMFPLSTYLRNLPMFQRTPVIACVSYFMTENKSNLTIQRRGIDFIKYFTENQIGLSSIAMHSPSALMIAAKALHDVLDVQYSFCRIIIAVSQSDDFARDNLIRFQVHTLLVDIILRQHPEQARLACMAATELASNDQNVISMCQTSGLVECIVALLDALPNDTKVQVEGLRALCAVNQVPEFLLNSKRATTFGILKKTKRFLHSCLKSDKLDGYERTELEELLADPLWNNEKCVIS